MRKLIETIIDNLVDLLARIIAVGAAIWYSVRPYLILTTVTAGAILLAAVILASWLRPDTGEWLTDNRYRLLFGSVTVGLVYAHSVVKSWHTLFFILLSVAVIFGWIYPTNAGELSEPVPAAELKVTSRGTGEDLQQALERARRQLPEKALAVGVECIPEPDGLINCSYLYRLPNGEQAAAVSCNGFSPYHLCMYGNACYGEGAIIEQQGNKTICQREGRVIFEAQSEYKRLRWMPIKEK